VSFGPGTIATLAALAGFAVAMAAGADHEARSLRSQVAALLHRNG
jgi:hypothetical protein